MDKIKLEADLVQVLTGCPGCNITYILDVLERTRAVLGSVKRLLIQTLLAKASLRDTLFNIITFSNTGSCSELEGSTRDYLLCLSYTTRGSCYLIMFDVHGVLGKVGTFFSAKHNY
ncbi:hypothetical protein ATANTOWER_025215 [Ataeniobius toweri]|uniref:Uncharacterized protein n=1 Tax=Ataeniobius toweri TaxID=208326 RepID=A0ABU7AKM9_9TELE|nr:hypothetical protein [Ataeniobius toweri]